MTPILWSFVLLQMAMGAFDTLYHHEGTERLAWRPGQQTELGLHGIRNLAYAALFLALGFTVPQGGWAIALLILLLAELGITLWDFVEEDRTRDLPASERVTHTLLTLNYGVILALLVPWLWANAGLPAALLGVDYGVISWLCAIAAIGVILSGLRDVEAARRAKNFRTTPATQLADALDGHRHILLTGGTGFVGTRLAQALVAKGHRLTIVTRDKAKAARLLPQAQIRLIEDLAEIAPDELIDAIVNLAGEPLANGLWTKAKKNRILTSRITATRALTDLIDRLEDRPAVMVSGSAVGWYGMRGDEPLCEASPPQDCFSHHVCAAWEAEARRAEDRGLRVVRLRIGLVFDRSGGMLARLLLPFEFFLGGRIGKGDQVMSWIHRDDLVRLIIHALASPALSGAVNATAPHPISNREFTKALARALHRPAFMPLPQAPLRWALRGFAEELLLGGQRVIPAKALATGFEYTYPDINEALVQICGLPPKRQPNRPAAKSVTNNWEGRLLS